jgi:hypothetical protein
MTRIQNGSCICKFFINPGRKIDSERTVCQISVSRGTTPVRKNAVIDRKAGARNPPREPVSPLAAWSADTTEVATAPAARRIRFTPHRRGRRIRVNDRDRA